MLGEYVESGTRPMETKLSFQIEVNEIMNRTWKLVVVERFKNIWI